MTGPPQANPLSTAGHVPGLTPPGRPCQAERLPGDSGHPGVAVGLDDVVPFQPGFVDDVRPGGDRPPPAREVPLPPVSRRLPKWPCAAEIDLACVLEGDGALTATVIHLHELNPVGQFARDNRRMTRALHGG